MKGHGAWIKNEECGVRNAEWTVTQHPTPNTQHLDSVRLGCLPYLNVKPLVYPFEHGRLPESWDLVYAAPSMLARMLEDGRIDAAPVSSFACISNSNLAIVPGICIASHGPVQSVLMLSKTDPHDVRTVAADTSSLSGRAMLRIILSETYGIEPEFVDCEPNVEAMIARYDAALIIGNPAMLCDKTDLKILDLGEEWLKLTGLPAVFAVWAGPKEAVTEELTHDLTAAKQEGLEHINEIVEEQSRLLDLPADVCHDYLADIMKYDLSEPEIESLRIFGNKAQSHGLIGGEAYTPS